jgi:ABC-type transporter Mla subunit MlaD
MLVLLQLSAIALRQVAGPGSDAAINALTDRYTDRSTKLIDTLKSANAQAWKAVEIALAGSSWWDRAKRTVASGDQTAFRKQVQAFLEATPPEQLPGADDEFRRVCLTELKAARRAGLLPGEEIPDTNALRTQAKALARFEDPKAVLDAEFDSISKAASALREHGYENLGRLVALRPPGGRPLIVIAVEYFFRRDVLADPMLSAELQFHTLEKLSEQQEAGFHGLHLALKEQGDRIEDLLDSALELLEQTHAVTRQTRDDVRALRDEMQQQAASQAALYEAILKAIQQLSATNTTTHRREPTLEPSADTVAAVKALVGQAGAMPITEKRQHKALFRAVGKLKASVHAYEARRKTRKNVLPSSLFSSQPTAATPEPEAASLPIAEPPHEPASLPEPVKVKSIFGEVPKPKIRRNKPGAGPS